MSALALQALPRGDWEDVSAPVPAGFRLASGDVLDDEAVLMRLHGAPRGPVVAVLGGISAGRRVAGEDGWWKALVRRDAPLDLERFCVLGFDFAPLGDRRVRMAPDDQARLIELALAHLGVARLHAFVGASYGGMVGLALAERAPERVGRLCVISACSRPSALGLAWRGVQRRMVEFGLKRGDGAGGLALARQLAMTTYRGAEEFDARFGAGVDAEGRGEVDRYLIARGEAYAAATAPRRWLSLSESIDRHSIDPARIVAPTTLVACSSDQLAPLADMQAFAGLLPRLSAFHVLASIYGHDAFLKETAALGPILSRALESDAHA